MRREVQVLRPGQQTAIRGELYKRACSAGANVDAVWFRIAMLGMLETFGCSGSGYRRE